MGSGGFMGRHLVENLKRLNVEVLEASSANGSGIDPDSGLLPFDYKIPAGTECVAYLAQSPKYRDPGQASHVLSVNVVSAVRAGIAACEAGVKRFIYVSTGTVYAPSFSPLAEDAPLKAEDWYALSKIHGEQAIRMFDTRMNVHVVRPFGVYGNFQSGRLVPNLVSAIAENRPVVLQQKRRFPEDKDGLKISLCHIFDATQIITNLIFVGGPPILNLAGNEAVSIRDIANTIGRVLGKEPIFKISPVDRKFDLIADTNLLEEIQKIDFISLDDGIKSFVLSGASELLN